MFRSNQTGWNLSKDMWPELRGNAASMFWCFNHIVLDQICLCALVAFFCFKFCKLQSCQMHLHAILCLRHNRPKLYAFHRHHWVLPVKLALF